jgi:hypothetical protein
LLVLRLLGSDRLGARLMFFKTLPWTIAAARTMAAAKQPASSRLDHLMSIG